MRYFYIIFAVFLVLIVSCSSHRSGSSDDMVLDFSSVNQLEDTTVINQLALKFFIEGTKLHNQKKYKDAIIEYHDALRLDSSFAIHYAIAKSYRELRRYNLAEQHLLIAVNQKSNFTDALELLAEIQFLQGFSNNDENIKKAILTMKRIIKLKPTEKNKFMLARIYEYTDTETAISKYKELLNENVSRKVLFRLLSVYEDNDAYEEYYALKSEYKDELLISPEDFFEIMSYNYIKLKNKENQDLLNYAENKLSYDEMNDLLLNLIFYIVENKNEQFENHSDMIIDKYNSAYSAYANLQYAYGILHYFAENKTKSENFFMRAANLSETPENIFTQTAYFYYSNQDYEKALSNLKKSNEISQSTENLLFISQIYSINNQDYINALKYAKKSYETDSTNTDVLGNIANIYNYLDSNSKSDKYFEKALDVDSTDAFINNNYAYSLANRKKDLEKALKMSKIAIDQNPDNAAYLDTYGWILYKKGEYHKARIYLEEAIKKTDLSSEVFEHLGDIYRELKMYNNAIEAYKKALEYDEYDNRIYNKIKEIKDQNMIKE